MHQRTISHYDTMSLYDKVSSTLLIQAVTHTHISLQYMYVCTLILIQLGTVTV